MKVALIDHKPYYTRMFRERLLAKGGIEMKMGLDTEDFENQHGPLENFDAILLHPGIQLQARYLAEFPERYKDKKLAIVALGASDYPSERIPVFAWRNTDTIYEFLTK